MVDSLFYVIFSPQTTNHMIFFLGNHVNFLNHVIESFKEKKNHSLLVEWDSNFKTRFQISIIKECWLFYNLQIELEKSLDRNIYLYIKRFQFNRTNWWIWQLCLSPQPKESPILRWSYPLLLIYHAHPCPKNK